MFDWDAQQEPDDFNRFADADGPIEDDDPEVVEIDGVKVEMDRHYLDDAGKDAEIDD